MSPPPRGKQVLFWAGVVIAAYGYVLAPRLHAPEADASWTADGTGVCWHWRAEDGHIAQCCRVRAGLWWDADRRLCDGAHPGHGAPEPTR